jgi:nicotinamide-nucleotide amidase
LLFDMSLFPEDLVQSARILLDDANIRGIKIVTAESCTGGLVAALLTEIAGSSSIVERGFVVYSNNAKQEMLGVPGDMIADYGAVSEPVARALAEGALIESRANLSIAITGVAGPGGGTGMKPVGLVHFASARENRAIRHEEHRFGDIGRTQIRLEAVRVALRMLQEGI